MRAESITVPGEVLIREATQDDFDVGIAPSSNLMRKLLERGDVSPRGLQVTSPTSIDRRDFANLGTKQRSLALRDFVYHAPTGRYVYLPSGEWWTKSGVDSRLQWSDPHRPPSSELRECAAVDQMTWSPGDKQIIDGRLIDDGGWKPAPNARCLNMYRPPTPTAGDALKAGPWIDHVRALYAGDADHIMNWLAHRIQHPGQKINHALVLGGAQGIGKDSLLEPIVQGVGPWNVSDITPAQFVGRFNTWAKAVVVRINEARDRRECSPAEFYENAKIYMAAPPEMLRVDEKGVVEYKVPNVCAIVITTNNKLAGVYLPPDDRRHFVAWSDVPAGDPATAARTAELWRWYSKREGIGNVIAHLKERNLSGFDPKAPPPRTDAWRSIVAAGVPVEDSELADLLDEIGWPNVLTLSTLIDKARERQLAALADSLADRSKSRLSAVRLHNAGYDALANPNTKGGEWSVSNRRVMVYMRPGISKADGYKAVAALQQGR